MWCIAQKNCFLCWWILKFIYHWVYSLKYSLIKDVCVWEGNKKLFARLVPGGLALGRELYGLVADKRELAGLGNMTASVRLSPFFNPPPATNSRLFFVVIVVVSCFLINLLIFSGLGKFSISEIQTDSLHCQLVSTRWRLRTACWEAEHGQGPQLRRERNGGS